MAMSDWNTGAVFINREECFISDQNTLSRLIAAKPQAEALARAAVAFGDCAQGLNSAPDSWREPLELLTAAVRSSIQGAVDAGGKPTFEQAKAAVAIGKFGQAAANFGDVSDALLDAEAEPFDPNAETVDISIGGQMCKANTAVAQAYANEHHAYHDVEDAAGEVMAAVGQLWDAV